MTTRLAKFALTLVLMTATTITSQAQNQGTVLWSSPASGCVAQTAGQTSAYFSAVYGTVSFAPGQYGDLKLTCPVPFLSYLYLYYGLPNKLFITYYNDHGSDGGVNHCYISADLLRSNLNNQERGADLASLNTSSQVSSGRQTLGGFVSENMDFQNNYYWVDIQLHRDAANAACNPTLVGTYLTNMLPF